MRAFVVHDAGGPEALKLEVVDDPTPAEGWVLIDIEGFGLNRAEAITRAGGSGNAVPFPRIIGIECVGTVIDGGGTDLRPGQTVAAAMGGLGRAHDGSYAEQTLARRANVFPLTTDLDWATLAAIPETFFTAWGCLRESKVIGPDGGTIGQQARVVVRPGASALGLAITQLVNGLGGEVVGVTRSEGKVGRLLEAGMVEVVVSDNTVADTVMARWSGGPTAIIDTIASDASIADDLSMLADGGVVCLAGSLADSYGSAPSSTAAAAFARPDVTFYSSETIDAATETKILQSMVDRVAAGDYEVNIDTVFGFDELVEAHRQMEANRFAGKAVVLT